VNERIKLLAKEANCSIDGMGYGEGNLEKFAELIIQECCDWIDGSPANDAGQLHLTKSFIIANLKGMFRGSKE